MSTTCKNLNVERVKKAGEGRGLYWQKALLGPEQSQVRSFSANQKYIPKREERDVSPREEE